MSYTLTNNVPSRVTNGEFRHAYETARNLCVSAITVLNRYLSGRATAHQRSCVLSAFQESERGANHDIRANPRILRRVLNNYRTIRNRVLPNARYTINNTPGIWGFAPDCSAGPTTNLSGVAIQTGALWITSGSDVDCTYTTRLNRRVSRSYTRRALQGTSLIHESVHYVVGRGHGRLASHNPYFYEHFVLGIRFGESFEDQETSVETGRNS